MSDLVRVDNLSVRFKLQEGNVTAVDGVSFRIEKGKTVALVGESGSGKSTVAQALMGILPRSGEVFSGRMLFDDAGQVKNVPRNENCVDIAALPPDGPEIRSLRGGAISMIFQDPMSSLSPLYTVGNQVGEAFRLHAEKNLQTDVRQSVIEMLDKVGFPDPVRAHDLYPFEMSGGMRQRAMIAMALISKPSLLIADEPTTALDVTVQAQTLALIQRLQKDLGMAVLLITHDLGIVSHMADETVVMYKGRVVESGITQDLFDQPKHPYLQALFRALPSLSASTERLVPLRAVDVRAGSLARSKDVHAVKDGPILSVENVVKSFTAKKGGWFSSEKRRIHAVNGVSFEIMRGESLGLVGESGCGKTTVSKMIMSAVRPDTGTIRYLGAEDPQDLHGLDSMALFKMRRKLQYVFQDPASSLDPRMTVYNLVAEPLVIHEIGDHAHRVNLVKELINLVGLDATSLNRYPHSFSGGQKQRIGIARALALQPDILICDEPVSALDVSIQAQVLNLLKDLQEELSLTYLFVSHNLAVVRYLCSRILVMCKGRIVEEGSAIAIFENPQHPYTKALLSSVPDPAGSGDWLNGVQLGSDDGASVPDMWPAPYCLLEGDPGVMRHVGSQHRVLFSGAEVAA